MALPAFAVPLQEMTDFGELPQAAREDVRLWLGILGQFAKAQSKSAAIATLRAQGHSQGTLYRKLARFREDGWRGLVNATRLKKVETLKLPPPFVDFWQAHVEENQRKIAPAYRSLFADFLLAGKSIPGYGDWRAIWHAEHEHWAMPDQCPYRAYDNTPRGWGYRNLLRYAPDIYQLTAARIGTGAASQYLPSVPTTRVGLELGQFYVVDDMYHDLRVNFVGNRAAQIPLELGALELLSGHYCVWGIKPVREREDGTREHLRASYMRYLLAHLLCRVGMHPDGCTIVGEHGTAKVDTDLLDAINDGIEDLYKRAPQAFVVDDIPTSAPALGALADTLLMRTAYREKLALYAASKLLSQDAEDNANLELAKFYRADYEQGLP
jgi:hypothetical protein